MTRLPVRSNGAAETDSVDFDTLAQHLMKEFHVPGLSIAIIEGEKVTSKAFGFADLESKTPVSPETLFYIGSITKSFLGTSLVKYIASDTNKNSKEKITVKTPLSHIIRDDFVLADEWATNHITFEDALSHRTGSASHDYSYGDFLDSQKAVTRNMRYLPFSSDPRTNYEYCNNMYVASSHALETLLEKPFADILREQIFDPLGMKDAYTTKDEARAKGHGKTRLYSGYTWAGKTGKEAQGKYVKQDHVNLKIAAGAGCIITNVLEMAKYAKAWLGQNETALSADVREEVTKPRITAMKMPFEDTYSTYSLGLSRRSYRGLELISHTGGLPGYTSFFTFVPSKEWAFVGLGNGDWAQCVEEVLLYHSIDNFLGIKAADRYDYIQRNRDLIHSIITKDSNAAKKHFPDAPVPGQSSVLPIEKYVGTFANPGYHSFTFKVAKKASSKDVGKEEIYLESHAPERTWTSIFQLFHITSEYWVGYHIRGLEEMEGEQVRDFKAMSRIGPDGEVQAWGLMLEPTLESKTAHWEDGLIWFEKVTDSGSGK